MSRIGKQPITIPSGVTVEVAGDEVKVKGTGGQLVRPVVDLVSVAVQDNAVVVSRANDSKPARANHGLMRSLINNMVIGVSQGFEKRLEVIGVGYRAEMKGQNLVLHLGYSHPIEFGVPSDLKIEVDKKANIISVKGASKERVGQIAANIRGFREPDHYKGKGVRYQGEYVRLKAGKSA